MLLCCYHGYLPSSAYLPKNTLAALHTRNPLYNTALALLASKMSMDVPKNLQVPCGRLRIRARICLGEYQRNMHGVHTVISGTPILSISDTLTQL